jgi:hypothetical protein
MEHSIPVVVPNPRAEQRFQYEAVAQAARYASETVRELGKGLTDTQKMRLFLEAAGTFAGGVGETTSTTAAGNLKDIFAKLTDVRPMHAVLQESEEFESQDALGGTYKFPALLSFAGGSIPSAFGVIPSASGDQRRPGAPGGPVRHGAGLQHHDAHRLPVRHDGRLRERAEVELHDGGEPDRASPPRWSAERDAEVSHLLGQFGCGVVSGHRGGDVDHRRAPRRRVLPRHHLHQGQLG